MGMTMSDRRLFAISAVGWLASFDPGRSTTSTSVPFSSSSVMIFFSHLAYDMSSMPGYDGSSLKAASAAGYAVWMRYDERFFALSASVIVRFASGFVSSSMAFCSFSISRLRNSASLESKSASAALAPIL